MKKWPFSRFLEHRFTPCVFCFSSDVVKTRFPGFQDEILSVWAELQSRSDLKIRLLFIDALPTFATVRDELTNLRHLNPGSAPFDFLTKPWKYCGRRETESIVLLRQRLIDVDFMPLCQWIDIPLSLLTISHAGEAPTIPDVIPAWAKAHLSRLRTDRLRFPCSDLPGILTEWHSKSLTVRFREAVSSVEGEFAKFWGSGFLQPLRDMFATQTGPAAALVALKFYADCRLMQRQYREARSCYQSVIANTPATHVSFLSQVHFCFAASDIVQSNLSARTVQSIQNSLLLSSSPTHSLTCTLLDFWVKIRLSLDFSMTLRSVAYSENPAKVFQLAKPFFMQQIARLSRPGRRVWMMEAVSDAFLELDCREHSLRCLWEAFNILRDKKWDFIAQQLLGRIVNRFIRDRFDVAEKNTIGALYHA
jgi:hypothetical protein